jgi:hypothetical protein
MAKLGGVLYHAPPPSIRLQDITRSTLNGNTPYLNSGNICSNPGWRPAILTMSVTQSMASSSQTLPII